MRLSVLFLIFFFVGEISVGSIPVLRVLGRAGDHVVTSREIEMDIVVEQVLFKAKKISFEDQVNKVLLEWAVFQEASAFGISQLSSAEVNGQIDKFNSLVKKSRFAGRWKQLDVQSREVRKLIDRKLRARKFVNFKATASYVPVTDAEALNYYQKNRKGFGRASFSKMRKKIKDLISHERAERRLEDWYSVLRRKYNVRRAAR